MRPNVSMGGSMAGGAEEPSAVQAFSRMRTAGVRAAGRMIGEGVTRRAQMAAQGISLGAASPPTPVPQSTGIGDAMRLRTLLAQLAAQGGGAAGSSMSELQWQPQVRRPTGEYAPDPRASWLARRV